MASEVPVPAGFVEEAIAKHYLGPKAQWIGGRNPGYDFLCETHRVDVKAGVLQQRRLTPGTDPVDTIGIRLNGGLEALPHKPVDEIMVVVRDRNAVDTHMKTLIADGDSGELHLRIRFDSAEVYRVPVSEMAGTFQRPYTADGRLYKSIANVDTPIAKIQPYRVSPVTV